jgi:hypothetical protein
MKTNININSTMLHIWIAEHGDDQARKHLCETVNITSATLCRILKGHVPKFEIRYRIYKETGIKLSGSDLFPEKEAS